MDNQNFYRAACRQRKVAKYGAVKGGVVITIPTEKPGSTSRRLEDASSPRLRNHIALDANGASVFPTSLGAVKRCALGALIAAVYELTHDYDAADHLAYEALRPHCGTSTLIYINDTTGHAAVLELFDQVIAMKSRL